MCRPAQRVGRAEARCRRALRGRPAVQLCGAPGRPAPPASALHAPPHACRPLPRCRRSSGKGAVQWPGGGLDRLLCLLRHMQLQPARACTLHSRLQRPFGGRCCCCLHEQWPTPLSPSLSLRRHLQSDRRRATREKQQGPSNDVRWTGRCVHQASPTAGPPTSGPTLHTAGWAGLGAQGREAAHRAAVARL